jgi:outer membrane PBP1 activator LpoA protein
MKNLFLFAIFAGTVAFTSCGNAPTKEEQEKMVQDADSEFEALMKKADQAANDSTPGDTTQE